MMLKTHLAFGFLVALAALKVLGPENQLLFAFVLLIGAAFPDIDHPKSRLGRIAWPISALFEHRGFFHSFFAIALFPTALFLISGSLPYSTAFLLGYASHIFADTLSTAGIMPLHPVMKFRLRGFMRTGALFETIIFFFLILLDIYFLFIM